MAKCEAIRLHTIVYCSKNSVDRQQKRRDQNLLKSGPSTQKKQKRQGKKDKKIMVDIYIYFSEKKNLVVAISS